MTEIHSTRHVSPLFLSLRKFIMGTISETVASKIGWHFTTYSVDRLYEAYLAADNFQLLESEHAG